MIIGRGRRGIGQQQRELIERGNLDRAGSRKALLEQSDFRFRQDALVGSNGALAIVACGLFRIDI